MYPGAGAAIQPASKSVASERRNWPTSFRSRWSAIGSATPEAITSKHYLQVIEDHSAKAVQNPVQQAAVLPRTGSQADLPAHERTPVLQGFAAGCEVVQSGRVEDRGLEPDASSCRNTHVSGEGGAKSGAVDGENRPIDPDLAHLIGVWDSLKPDTRTAILAIVEAAQGR